MRTPEALISSTQAAECLLSMARCSRMPRKAWLRASRALPLAIAIALAFSCRSMPLFLPAPAEARHVHTRKESVLRPLGPLAPLALLTPITARAEDSPGDWFEPFVDINAKIIEGIDGIVGSAGLAIILYTVIIKVATFPLQQPALRTSALMQLLSPQTDEIERKYPLDEEGRGRTLRELYGKVGLNPFAAFLPILFQLPIFIALFRAIGKLASQDEHFKERVLSSSVQAFNLFVNEAGDRRLMLQADWSAFRSMAMLFALHVASSYVRSRFYGSQALPAQLPAEGQLCSWHCRTVRCC